MELKGYHIRRRNPNMLSVLSRRTSLLVGAALISLAAITIACSTNVTPAFNETAVPVSSPTPLSSLEQLQTFGCLPIPGVLDPQPLLAEATYPEEDSRQFIRSVEATVITTRKNQSVELSVTGNFVPITVVKTSNNHAIVKRGRVTVDIEADPTPFTNSYITYHVKEYCE